MHQQPPEERCQLAGQRLIGHQSAAPRLEPPVAGPREYSTTQGLLAIGDVSNFKIYVKTATGNERGSNTVEITRTT